MFNNFTQFGWCGMKHWWFARNVTCSEENSKWKQSTRMNFRKRFKQTLTLPPPFSATVFYSSDFWECVDLKVFWNLFLLKYSLNINPLYLYSFAFAQRGIWINISIHRHVELSKVYQSCSTLIFSMKSYIFTLMHYVFGNILCKNFTIN